MKKLVSVILALSLSSSVAVCAFANGNVDPDALTSSSKEHNIKEQTNKKLYIENIDVNDNSSSSEKENSQNDAEKQSYEFYKKLFQVRFYEKKLDALDNLYFGAVELYDKLLNKKQNDKANEILNILDELDKKYDEFSEQYTNTLKEYKDTYKNEPDEKVYASFKKQFTNEITEEINHVNQLINDKKQKLDSMPSDTTDDIKNSIGDEIKRLSNKLEDLNMELEFCSTDNISISNKVISDYTKFYEELVHKEADSKENETKGNNTKENNEQKSEPEELKELRTKVEKYRVLYENEYKRYSSLSQKDPSRAEFSKSLLESYKQSYENLSIKCSDLNQALSNIDFLNRLYEQKMEEYNNQTDPEAAKTILEAANSLKAQADELKKDYDNYIDKTKKLDEIVDIISDATEKLIKYQNAKDAFLQLGSKSDYDVANKLYKEQKQIFDAAMKEYKEIMGIDDTKKDQTTTKPSSTSTSKEIERIKAQREKHKKTVDIIKKAAIITSIVAVSAAVITGIVIYAKKHIQNPFNKKESMEISSTKNKDGVIIDRVLFSKNDNNHKSKKGLRKGVEITSANKDDTLGFAICSLKETKLASTANKAQTSESAFSNVKKTIVQGEKFEHTKERLHMLQDQLDNINAQNKYLDSLIDEQCEDLL